MTQDDMLPPGSVKSLTITRYDGGIFTEALDSLAMEITLTVAVDGEELVRLQCSPGKEVFLAVGFLRGEALVSRAEDITGLDYDRETSRVSINLAAPSGAAWRREALVRTSSGAFTGSTVVVEAPAPAGSGYSHKALLGLMEKFCTCSRLFQATGCVHSAALSDGHALLLFADDIGRHNAFDKVAGEALMTGLDCRGKILFTSGRISSEVVLKAARIGIGAIVSPSAPTLPAVETAEHRGILLMGFARGGRANIYTCFPRPE